jgi:hypothetical protein
MIVNYKLGDHEIALELIGETIKGVDEVILLKDENLIENTSWQNVGYSIEEFVFSADFTILKDGIKLLIIDKIIEAGGEN